MEMQSECGVSEGQNLCEALGSFGWVSVNVRSRSVGMLQAA